MSVQNKNKDKTVSKDPKAVNKSNVNTKDSKGVAQKENKNKEGANESPKKKSKGKNMFALIHTLPKNLEEQQEAFFENDCKINPQFEYENFALT